jgi:nitrate reductase NapAB chaperone NapD
MSIRGYLVLTEPGAAPAAAERIAALPGCEVVRSERHDLLLLVTETEESEDDAPVRARVEATPGVSTMILTFGELASAAASDRCAG